ncbi:MAG: glycosyl hydrolase [Bacteroidota bacterium]
MRKHKWFILAMAFLMLFPLIPIEAQMKPHFLNQEEELFFNAGVFHAMKWRNIGPHRGGRSNAVSGVKGQPMTYYMGTVGGGVWKTEDAGLTWENISDGYMQTASVGAIAVAESDPNIIYVGMGEHAVRGVMSSHGDGVYRSTDAGKTWQHLGLSKTRHISKIVIHPENPDHIWVAAQGSTFKSSKDRGIYVTTDAGETWEHQLYINPTSGASDLSIDLSNPRIIYAAIWDHQRKPWYIRSGGTGSGLYKSIDGGTNWTKLQNGLPGVMGKVGVAVSRANPNIIYAILESEVGGVFRSGDAGENWEQVTADRATIGRAWYYTKVVADPVYEKGIYVLNAPLLKSTDGGLTYEQVNNPHSDQHDLWINPDNPKNMILGNDGGACITFNGGKSWSSQKNQPTAQLYRVIADNQFPYHLYAGQQDNSAFGIASRTASEGISENDWFNIGNNESAFVALNPDDPSKIYSTNYQGNISIYESSTGMARDIMAYPNSGLASLPGSSQYRFNWNAPAQVSPHNPEVLYHAANVVLKTEDQGKTWQEISPDLTRNQESKQGAGGGPFTNEGAGAEVYNTISYMVCSPLKAGEIWIGTDDGLVHYTKDEGKTWKNITPPNIGAAYVNSIELSQEQGKAYVVASKYKFGLLMPMIYRTEDYGKTWKKITNGIPANVTTRVVREDPVQKQILYAGTENGLFVSFNYGDDWHAFQLNLPICPITDLLIKDNDLVAATAGRSFWILDDLSPIQQSLGQAFETEFTLYKPKPQVRLLANAFDISQSLAIGTNPVNGSYIDYFVPDRLTNDTFILSIYNDKNKLVRTFTNQKDSTFIEYEGGPFEAIKIPTRAGLNRFHWDMRRNSIPGIDQIFVNGTYEGGMVPPGVYQVSLSNGKETTETELVVLPDPRLKADWKDFQLQTEVLTNIERNVSDIHLSVGKMRVVKNQIETLVDLLQKSKEHEDLVLAGNQAIQKIDLWEQTLIQTKQETHQDVINFSNGLNAELLDLKRRVDTHNPVITEGAVQRLDDLLVEWKTKKSLMQEILEREVNTFNQIFKEKNIPALIIPKINAF